MPIATILLADNDPDYLSTCSEYLESNGYKVFTANSSLAAREIFEHSYIHLAILDLRLNDDDNEKDRSGLTLAKESTRTVPKLILTKFPAHEDVREAMKLDNQPFPPAVDFVDKRKGLEHLLSIVQQVFEIHLRINWSLEIEWKEESAHGLVNRIDKNLVGSPLLIRAVEFEDLLRKLFFEKIRIRVDQIVWRRNQRIALIVYAFTSETSLEAFLVVCGPGELIRQDIKRYEEFAPKSPGDSGTTLYNSVNTIHFAANAFAFVNNDLEATQRLLDVYRTSSEKFFNMALTSLIQDTLADWWMGKQFSLQGQTSAGLYQKILGIDDKKLSPAALDALFNQLEHRALEVNLVIKRTEPGITFNNRGVICSASNPVHTFRQVLQQIDLALTVNTPGILTGENVLIDQLGHAWLTDFSEAGMAPLYWDFVTLEAAVRFDWFEHVDILRRQEMEKSLTSLSFNRLDIRDFEPQIRKVVRAIQIIRKLSHRALDQNPALYYKGLFFHALRRLLEYDPSKVYTTGDLTRFLHLYLSTSLLANWITDISQNSDIQPEKFPELNLDLHNHSVLIGADLKHLSDQPFRLLVYLFNNSGRVCTTEELLQNVIGDGYTNTYIHTLIGRIRSVIEPDPSQPKYLLSTSGVGYRLILRPKP